MVSQILVFFTLLALEVDRGILRYFLRSYLVLDSFAFHTGFTSSGIRTNTGDLILHSLEVLLAPQAINYNIVPSGIPEPRTVTDATVNYTIEETVNGTVFLITRTKFPDGSTIVINSIPKP